MRIACECGKSYVNFSASVKRIACKCGAVVELPAHAGDMVVSTYEPSPVEIDAQRDHWRKLHLFPLGDTWVCKARCDFWQRWSESIPNIECDCRKHWRELVEKHPPDFSSREAFFRWSVDRHNDVNARLGKPIVSYSEACQLYGANFAENE